jgi:hypothetical protein
LGLAPESVRRILADLPPSRAEVVNSSEESNGLKQAYLDAGVVGQASRNDAAHIALSNDLRRRTRSELELQAHRPF